MYGEYIKFGSVTSAQRAQKILEANGIASKVGKNPSPKQTEGCGYALFVHSDAANAVRMLSARGIASKGTGKVNVR